MGGVLRKQYEKFLIYRGEFDKMHEKFLIQGVNLDFCIFLFRGRGDFE